MLIARPMLLPLQFFKQKLSGNLMSVKNSNLPGRGRRGEALLCITVDMFL
jgi:hypothetical protein